MKIRTQLTAGGVSLNHNEALRVRSAVKAGDGDRLASNHSEALQVRSALKAGRLSSNHSEILQVRSALKVGRLVGNHNEALRRDSYRPAISVRR